MTSVAVYPALAVIAGAALGLLDFSVALAPWLPAAACAAAALLHSRRPAAALACVIAGCACAGDILAAHDRRAALAPPLRLALDREVGGFRIDTIGPGQDHDPIPARGRLLEDAAIRDGFVSIRLHIDAIRPRAEWLAARGVVTLSIGGEAAAARADGWRAGRVIAVPVTFRRPARYLNDGVQDFERDLALDGVALFASARSGLLVDVVERGSDLDEWTANVRRRVRAAVGRWVSPHGALAGGIVTAVLIGDRTGLPDAIRDRLQAAGTYHVIAISGGNIAILAALVNVLLMTTGLRRRSAAAAGIAVLLLYAQVAVAGPSVWRATLMAVLYLAARVIDHRTAVWQATGMAAALMVVTHPLDLRDAGFLLTFGATVALVEGGRRALREGQPRLRAWLAASVVASLAVEIALLPVAAQVFSRVTIAGLLLNLLAVPLMAVAQVGGMVAVAADALPGVAAMAGWLAATAATGIVESARLVEVAPWLTSPVPPPGVAVVAAYYAFLLLALFRPPGSARRMAIAAFTAVAVAIVLPIPPLTAPAHPLMPLRLTMFDVGQGEAMLLESGAERLLIDAGGPPFGGGTFDIGSRVLAPALWAHGVRSLGALLVTHGDPDHAGGAASVVDIFSPAAFWEGIIVSAHEPSRQLRDRAAARGLRPALRRAGEAFTWGAAAIRVLHPPEPDWERPRVRNDDSVVLEVRHGDVALLLTGDIGADVERAVVQALHPAPIRILKVAHHGSRTSTSAVLLDAWRPDAALISAGRGNTFGHPAPEVLARLDAAGTRIFRTDRHGQVTVESDGRGVTVRTYTGDAASWP